MTEERKPSAQEGIKADSLYLKGNIAEELADENLAEVSVASYELLKFHGTYQGYNRDTATERKKAGLDKEHEFMVRLKLPAGLITAEQYLKLDELAGKYANGTLRITTRQSLQFHVVMKENLKQHIKEINEALLSTQNACGDVIRNITTSPAPIDDVKHRKLKEDALAVAEFIKPKTSAYKEIWTDARPDEARCKTGEDIPHAEGVKDETYEPLYGKYYLPRKFKIGLIVPEDNSIDVFTHDLGIVLIFEGEEFKGYNILLGGGMGMKHEAAKNWEEKKTYPRLADPIAFVGPDDLIKITEAVVKLQRDHGDRGDRQHARLKYIVQENGLDWVRKTLQEYFTKAGGGALQDPVAIEKYEIPAHMGWHEQKDGRLFLGVPIASGRIVDYGEENQSGYNPGENKQFAKARYRTALREVLNKYGMRAVLTPTEEIILCDIEKKDKADIEAMLKSYGIPLAEDHTNMQLHYMTCVALPTCAKALAESERVQFPIMDDIQAALDKHGLTDEKLTVRVAGCPNGCSRPYIGDIGIVGRMPGHYVLFIGGDFEGTRLGTKVFDKVPQNDIGKALEPMFALFKDEKQGGEGFGDFCHRFGVEKLVAASAEKNKEAKWAA